MAKGSGGAVLGYLKYVLGLDSLAFEEGLSDADKRLKAAQRSLSKTAAGFSDVGKKLSLAVTAPVLGVGAAIVKMGGDFEAGMNRLSISSQATAGDLKAMNDLALKLGKDTTFGATDAADAMDELAKNGLSAKQILEGAATAAVNLASAAGSELSPASKAISDVMQQFKIGAAELPGAVNQITGAVNQSKLDFVDYAAAIAQAGGVAGGVGVKFDDFNAAIAGTSALFASGADAGTSFKTFLLALPGNSKAAVAAIKEYGLSFYDAQGNMRSMSEIAEQLKVKLGGLSDEAKTDVLKTIFGNDAMRTAIGLMDQGAKGLDLIKSKIAETDAAAQSAQRLKGFNGQMEQLKGATETLAITIAQSGVLEAITAMVAGLGNFVDGLAETNPEFLKWGAAIAVVTAAIGPLVIGIGSIISAFGTMLPLLIKTAPLWTGLATIISGTVIPVLLTVGRALIGLAIAGGPLTLIAAAVAAVYIAWKNWDKIGPVLQQLYTQVKTWLMDKLSAAFNAVKEGIQSVADKFKWLWDVVVGHSYVPDLVDGVADEFARLDDVMVDPTVKATETTGAAFENMANTALNALSNLAQAIKGGGVLDILSAAFNAFGAIAGTGLLGKGLKTGFADFKPISGFRANGGPVSSGKSYVVGERGPEMFTPGRSGFVHANGSGGRAQVTRVIVNPSAYFDAVVDQRAYGVAAPMASQAAVAGSTGAQVAISRSGARQIP